MPDTIVSGMTRTAYAMLPVTPHATNTVPRGLCRALWINVAGNLDFYDEENNQVMGVAVLQGEFPCGVRRVLATSTASGIFAMY